jgi:signal transduction histidine kinase
VTWILRQLERLRSLNQVAVDSALAALLFVVCVITVYGQAIEDGLVEPTALAVVTSLMVSAPVAIRRRMPLLALTVGSVGILWHIVADWPEGFLPGTMMLLTYTVAAWDTPRRAWIGLAIIWATLIVLGFADTPGLDTIGVAGNIAIFTAWWTIGIALRARRQTLEARVREAEERANVERQSAARRLAEERLRIAQELHDVVAHSMSVIAVQAGVGAHVLDQNPDQARAALEAISTTSRGTLTEMRRLLGVLRDGEGERSHAPAPGLGDLPSLIEDVRRAGVPVSLTMTGSDDCPDHGTAECAHAGVELSAYRVVQEALTNVIKHAGTTSKVDVAVRYVPGGIDVEVADDGRGAAAMSTAPGGHGLLGMRERVEVWGGELSVGPTSGGGYRVRAHLPFGGDR